MKITKSQLKQIIKEEIAIFMEGGYAGHDVREKKEHPDETCEQAHPDETHEEWEEEPLRIGTPAFDPLGDSVKARQQRAIARRKS
jgi:hypothetical protein